MKRRLAKLAYEGYRNHTGGKSLVSGAPIPEWDDLSEAIQDAWVASVVAIRERICDEIRCAMVNAGYDIRERLMD